MPPSADQSVAGAGTASVPAETVSHPDSADSELEQQTTLEGVEIGPGAWIDHFRIRRILGVGGMGTVYLARDGQLGRSVAIKTVRADRLGRERTHRIYEEARLTARLNHPNVVVVHQVGSHKGAPYIAMEYLEGETLAARLERRPPGRQEAIRLLAQIADAVGHAHERGVIHRDLKPGNVILPKDGRLRVVDFGLGALWGEGSSRLRSPGGTRGYMAPEQIEGGTTGTATDIWAMGVVIAEMFGVKPHLLRGGGASLELLNPVPEAVRGLVASCLAKEPERRPVAQAVSQALGRALLGGDLEPDSAGPYRGLESFEARHAGLYFGREAEVASFVEALERAPLLGVVGASGAGKSSFVRAGVLPRLSEQGKWQVFAIRPGGRPLRQLAASLLSGGPSEPTTVLPLREDAVDALAARIAASPGALHLELERLAQLDGSKVLLLVDQLEEVFTHAVPPAERDAFLAALLGAADDPTEPIRAVFTVRDDFFGRIPRIGASAVTLLQAMSLDGLRKAVVEPARRAGYAFEEPSMVQELLGAVGGEAGLLPLLSFACRALWERRDPERRLLLREAFQTIGGAFGALAAHGDAVLRGLGPGELEAARSILLRLVGPEGTRRVVSREGLLAEVDARHEPVLERLTSARLVTVRRSAEGVAELELVHEALIDRWDRLRRWLDESREERVFAAEVEQAALLWQKRGARVEETWQGAALAEALAKSERLGARLVPPASTFLDEGVARERAIRRRRRAWLASVVSGLAALAVAATVAALAFWNQATALAQAADNVGRSTLRLELYDWAPSERRAVPRPAQALQELRWALHAPDPADPRRVGPRLEASVTPLGLEGGAPAWRVEARGGPAFLVVEGRGPAQGSIPCWPSVLPLRQLPGYADREAGHEPRLEAKIPTCQASAWNMVEVPGGPFYMGGPGVPPTQSDEEAGPLREVDLPTFWIARTEATNAEFSAFAANGAVTGIGPRSYPNVPELRFAAGADRPVASVDAHVAAAFCASHGQLLPSEEEWVKAARGGLWLDAERTIPNPEPRRSYPWPPDAEGSLGNLAGGTEGGTMPVGSFPAGASPYGILDLSGNVDEWTRTHAERAGLRVIRGGSYSARVELQHHSLTFQNLRPAGHSNFSLGVRCLTPGPSVHGSLAGTTSEAP